jgi:hypothetical protein
MDINTCNSADDIMDWKKCILCQSDDVKKGSVVMEPRPKSYEYLLDRIKERAELHEGHYIQLKHRLGNCTLEFLIIKKAVWYRMCYSIATSKQQIQRVKAGQDIAISKGEYTSRRGRKRTHTEADIETPTSALPFTRSSTTPYDKEQSFFCQKDDGKPLFNVRIENAGKELKQAVEKSNSACFKTRLNTSVSPADAHAIDVKYHKSFWRANVFRCLRDESSMGLQEQDRPLQRACLFELISLIDSQTRQKCTYQ